MKDIYRHRLIAHRGLTQGPDSSIENSPTLIEETLAQGYDVEVDVWWKRGGRWFLGHDEPKYAVTQSFLERAGIWVHCKNVGALDNATPEMHYFWHEHDSYTITSRGVIWTYPDTEPVSNAPCVLVTPEDWPCHRGGLTPRLDEIAMSLQDPSSDNAKICTKYVAAIHIALE